MSRHVPPPQSREAVGRKLAVNSVVSILTQSVYLLSRIAVTPFVLHHIPLEEYGLWTICFVILSYAGMSAFGVNNAYVKYISEYRSRNDGQSINDLASTGLLCMSGLSAILFLALYSGLPFVLDHFSITPDARSLTTILILGSAVAFLTDIGLGVFRGIIEGLQEVALSSWIQLTTALLEVVMIVAFLLLGHGVRGLLYAYVIKTFLMVGGMAFFSFARLPELSLSPRHFSRTALGTLFVFGGKIQLLGMLGICIETFDKIVTTSMLGLEATGLLEVGRKFPNTARGFSGAAFSSFMPAASYLGGWWEGGRTPSFSQKGHKYIRLILQVLFLGLAGLLPLLVRGPLDGMAVLPDLTLTGAGLLLAGIATTLLASGWWRPPVTTQEYFVGDEVRTIFLQGTRHVALINATVYCYLMACGGQLIFAWVGPGYEQTVPIVAIVGLSNMIHQSTGPGTFILRGINRSGKEFEYMLVQCILVLLWIPALTSRYGLLGTAWGFTLASTAGSLFFFHRAFRALRITAGQVLRQILVPCIPPAALAGCSFLAFTWLPGQTRWAAILHILLFGSLYLALVVMTLMRWILTDAECATLQRQARGLAARIFPQSRRKGE